MSEAMAHLRNELDRYDTLIETIYAFIKGRTDDVSIGIGRIIQPIEICSECGQENDYSQAVWCKCWSPVSRVDLDQLRGMGIELEDGP